MSPAKKAAKTTKKAAKKTTSRTATAKKSAKKTAKKAAKKTAKKATAAPARQVVVASKVKEALKDGDVRMASDFVDALNEEVGDLLDKAVRRAKDNNRSTVRPQDL